MNQRLSRRERRELAREAKKHRPIAAARPSCWYWLGPCLAAFIVYLPSLGFSFIRSDRSEISQIGSFWSELSQPVHIKTKYYRPLYSVWRLLVRDVAGFDSSVWHFSSVLLHVLTAYLVFRVSLILLKSRPAATFAALLFAVHAIHIDAVCWLLASSELLYTAAFLAALLLFLMADRGRWYLWASVAAWLAALFSKETAIVLLPLFLALAWVQAEGEWLVRAKRAILMALPYSVSAAVYLGIRSLVVPAGVFDEKLGGLPWSVVLRSAPFIAVSYLRKLVWPAGLSAMYDPHLRNAFNAEGWVVIALIACGLTVLMFLAMRHSIVGIATAILVLPLILAVYVARVSPTEEIIQDRYLYLPSVGGCLLLALFANWFWSAFPGKRKLIGFTVATVLAISAVLCLAQEGIYANPKALLERAVETTPNSPFVRSELGKAYINDGQYDLALVQYRRACELRFDVDCISGMAAGLYFAKRYEEALPKLQTLTRILGQMDSGRNPTTLVQHGQYLRWLTDTYAQLGDSEQARATGNQERMLEAQISANPQASELARAFGFRLQGEAPGR